MADRFSFNRIKTKNLHLNSITTNELLKERNMNISSFDKFQSFNTIIPDTKNSIENEQSANIIYAENPLMQPISVLKNINHYRFKYNHALVNLFQKYKEEKPVSKKNKSDKNQSESAQNAESSQSTEDKSAEDENIQAELISTAITASIFNPSFNVQVIGFTENVPLLQDVDFSNESVNLDLSSSGKNINNGKKQENPKINMSDILIDNNVDDCSVRELVKESHKYKSILGNARYRFTDFMYCKDLGKVPNNHMITLRKFPTPVGDQIFRHAVISPGSNKEGLFSFENVADVGRLISWFDTDDNKLEDILKYNYKATWKELKSERKDVQSKENESNRGLMGMAINTFSPNYISKMSQNRMSGGHNVYTKTASYIHNSLGWGKYGILDPATHDNNDFLDTQYDNNKVYTPYDTVQDTHTYEGKLQMSQEFSLTFSYKLRGYDNINPKSAMLDLLGNIYEVTYRRGSFWGGSRPFIGPAPNTQGWKKAKNLASKTWDKVGGFFKQLESGDGDLGSILGSFSGLADQAMSYLKNLSSNFIDKLNTNGGSIIKTIGGAIGGALANPGAKTQFMNMLGQPAAYAMDSLLKGDNVGLWHLTIGNPKNPILSCGNLILTDASIVHSGPLGIDDFPTELKVVVKLKHAKSRDLSELAKMYTKGINSIYMPFGMNKSENFITSKAHTAEKNKAEALKKNQQNYEEAIKNNQGNVEDINGQEGGADIKNSNKKSDEITQGDPNLTDEKAKAKEAEEKKVEQARQTELLEQTKKATEEYTARIEEIENQYATQIDNALGNIIEGDYFITSDMAFVAMTNQTNVTAANNVFAEVSTKV